MNLITPHLNAQKGNIFVHIDSVVSVAEAENICSKNFMAHTVIDNSRVLL